MHFFDLVPRVLFHEINVCVWLHSQNGAHNTFFVTEDAMKWLFKSEFFLYRLDEDATVAVYVTAKVQQTKQIFTSNQTFWADKPSIDMQVCLYHISYILSVINASTSIPCISTC